MDLGSAIDISEAHFPLPHRVKSQELGQNERYTGRLRSLYNVSMVR
jgi:hypothetical protein